MTGLSVGLAAWVALSLGGAGSEGAPPGSGLGTRIGPWAAGVTPEQQQEAEELFRQANELLRDFSYPEAVERYNEALKRWDHPAIHFNLAKALRDMLRLLECHKHLEAALRYGPAPLGPAKLKEAQQLKATVEEKLARLEITCEAPGAQVSLDERENLFVCPKSYTEWVQPGPHRVRATLAGFHPTQKDLVLKQGEQLPLPLKLYTDAQWRRPRRRWSEWMPWTVLGAGVAVGAGGGLLHLVASGQYRAFDAGIMECGGCVPPPSLAQARARGDILQGVAVGTYAAAGAGVAVGAVLLYLNVPQFDLIDPDLGPQVSVAPVLSPGSGGAVVTVRF